MKKLVKESINFKQHQEPIDSMNLGDVRGRMEKRVIESFRKKIENMKKYMDEASLIKGLGLEWDLRKLVDNQLMWLENWSGEDFDSEKEMMQDLGEAFADIPALMKFLEIHADVYTYGEFSRSPETQQLHNLTEKYLK